MNDWQNQDKLESKLRDKVYDHNESPSDGLWGKLNARLDAEAKPEHKKRFGWYWIAAVFLTGLAGFWAVGQLIEKPTTEKEFVSANTLSNKNLPAVENKTSPEKTTATIKVPGVIKKVYPRKKIPGKTTHVAASEKSRSPKKAKVIKDPVTPLRQGESVVSSEKVNFSDSSKENPESGISQGIPVFRNGNQELLYIDMRNIKFSSQPVVINPGHLALPVEKERWPAPVSGFSIAIVNNISYGISRYSAGSSPNAAKLDNAKLTNELSNGRVTPSFGVSAGIKLSDRLMLSAGFRRTIYSDKYSYSIKKAVSDPYKGTDPTLMAANYKHAGDSIMPGNTYSFINKFYCSEIPVTLSYYIPLHKKWNVVLDAGVSFMKVTYATAAYVDIDRVGFAVVQSLTEYPGFKMVTNLNLGMGLSYRLNSKFSFEASPYLRYGLNSMIKDKTFTQQSPAFIGINTTVRYHAF